MLLTIAIINITSSQACVSHNEKKITLAITCRRQRAETLRDAKQPHQYRATDIATRIPMHVCDQPRLLEICMEMGTQTRGANMHLLRDPAACWTEIVDHVVCMRRKSWKRVGFD